MVNFLMYILPQFLKIITATKEHEKKKNHCVQTFSSSRSAQVNLDIIPQWGSQNKGVVGVAGGAELWRKEQLLPRHMV